MRYFDKKWHVEIDDKGELRIKLHCECGDIHDIHLDAEGGFLGRGTFLGSSKTGIRVGQGKIKVAE